MVTLIEQKGCKALFPLWFNKKNVALKFVLFSITTTIHKMFEANPSFHVKQRTTGKVQFLFQQFFAGIDKIFILGVRLGTRL